MRVARAHLDQWNGTLLRLPLTLVVDVAGDADAAGLGQALGKGGVLLKKKKKKKKKGGGASDVDPIAQDARRSSTDECSPMLMPIRNRDRSALRTGGLWALGDALWEARLRIRPHDPRSCELDQGAVAHQLMDHAPAVLGDQRLDGGPGARPSGARSCPPRRRRPRRRRSPTHVRGQNRRELPPAPCAGPCAPSAALRLRRRRKSTSCLRARSIEMLPRERRSRAKLRGRSPVVDARRRPRRQARARAMRRGGEAMPANSPTS